MDTDSISLVVKSLPFICPSSPPPIDEAGAEDVDEEEVLTEDDTFDITGLSQKLSATAYESESSKSMTEILNDAAIYDLRKDILPFTSMHNLLSEKSSVTYLEDNPVIMPSDSKNEVHLLQYPQNCRNLKDPQMDEVGVGKLTVENEDYQFQSESEYKKLSSDYIYKGSRDFDIPSSRHSSDCANKSDSCQTPKEYSNGNECYNFPSHISDSNVCVNNMKVIGMMNNAMQFKTNDENFTTPLSKSEQAAKQKVNCAHNANCKASGNVQCKCKYSSDEDMEEFGDFTDYEKSKIEYMSEFEFCHDFGNQSEEENSELQNELRDKIEMAISDDEFGDFKYNISEKKNNNENFGLENVEKFNSLYSQNTSSKLYNLLSTRTNEFSILILKWVPLEPSLSDSFDVDKTVQKLDEIVEGDAFIWHHLEDIDSSSALKLAWSNTLSHKHFLSSINVDARNILLPYKWSSSVPLFAQTLSFSPLTPDKTLIKPWNPTLQSGQESQDDKQSVVSVLFLVLEKEMLAENTRTKSKAAPSPLIEKIMQESKNLSLNKPTPLESLPLKIRNIVSNLPNLNYMKSKVLMFPVQEKMK